MGEDWHGWGRRPEFCWGALWPPNNVQPACEERRVPKAVK